MPEFYWELVVKDGRSFEIPPSKVEVVKRRWDAKEPIHFSNESVNAFDIVRLERTGRPYGEETPLLAEGAAQAFNEPMLTDDGAIVCKWVKMQVPSREYSKHFSALPPYRRLSADDGIIEVAWRQPVHLINPRLVTECTEDEINTLTT